MSRAFGLLVKTRGKLYDSGIIRVQKLAHPVISVGNLTLGGTGKTPLVMALVERLRDEGWKPVVLSRGYKRTTTGMVVVSRGEGPLVRWNEAGDEPFLIAQRTRGAAVLVDADRCRAGRYAEAEGLGDIFVLDDGFQHRRLFRDFDLVTIDPVEWASTDRLLPVGRWREEKTAIARAHAACVQENPQVASPRLPAPTFFVQTTVEGLYDGAKPIQMDAVRGAPVVAFAGIAKPERFFATLRDIGITPTRCVRFRDHYAYTAHDVEALGQATKITTEKDAVRLEGAGISGFVHLRVSVNIPEFDRLMDLIRARIGRTSS